MHEGAGTGPVHRAGHRAVLPSSSRTPIACTPGRASSTIRRGPSPGVGTPSTTPTGTCSSARSGRKHAISETLTLATPLIFWPGCPWRSRSRADCSTSAATASSSWAPPCATYVGFTVRPPGPDPRRCCACSAAFLGGGVWGGIAGVLRATTGAHEVISTIMLNFIALLFLDYLLTTRTFLPPGQTNPVSKQVPDPAPSCHTSLRRPAAQPRASSSPSSPWPWSGGCCAGRPGASRSRRSASTPTPPATRACGRPAHRRDHGRGRRPGRAGRRRCGARHHDRGSPVVSPASIGFDAIAVALLGRSNPIGVLFAALLFGGLQAGAVGDAGEHVDADRHRDRDPGPDHRVRGRAGCWSGRSTASRRPAPTPPPSPANWGK